MYPIPHACDQKVNVRIASLDPMAPKASRDCRVCNRRRIKCDRSLPSCRKCTIRMLECTGYNQRLKWVQGVADRGKYAGQAAPIPRKDLFRAKDNDIITPNRSKSRSEASHVIEFLATTKQVLSGESTSNNGESNVHDRHRVLEGQYDPPLSWSQLPYTYQDPQVRRLVHHYDHHVATTFVWIDTPENRWRNDLHPLAQESHSLLFAILALASAHLSSKLALHDPTAIQLSAQSAQYRDRSLQILTQHLQNEVQKSSSGTAIPSILATMYLLCSVEMVTCDSTVWNIHLRGFHTMIKRWLSTPSRIDLLDTTSRYLVTQFSIVNVFASTTSFGNIEELSKIDLEEKGSTIFGDYMQTIHAITVKERERAALRHLGFAMGRADLASFAKRLENARKISKDLNGRLSLCTEQQEKDFNRVVDIYHHSGLIYAYQALAEPVDATECIPQLLASLISDLILISTSGPFAQDLAWPLFICGTACRHLKDEQHLIERLMREEMESTGFWNCQEALNFLRMFWSTEDVKGQTWIDFARQYCKHGREFLAL